MTENVLSILLELFEQADAQGQSEGANATSFYSRESAYARSLKDGVIYDSTVNGLIQSQFERVTGITSAGRAAYQELLKLREVDQGGVLADKLASAFIPTRAH